MPDAPRRPIWLTEAEAQLPWARKRWLASPDPVAALGAWFDGHFPGALDNKDLEEFAASALAALGYPEERADA